MDYLFGQTLTIFTTIAMAAPAPKIDILVLSSLGRLPMHGYEIKLELKYKHVAWWAKCQHGHLYASLKRLESRRFIRGKTRRDGGRSRRVFSITPSGRAWLKKSLADLAESPDSSYFDIDLFLSGTFLLEKPQAIELLAAHRRAVDRQRDKAEQLLADMGDKVPAAGRLIMEHRIEHLERESRFAQRAADVLATQKTWGPFLGDESIVDFLARTSVSVES